MKDVWEQYPLMFHYTSQSALLSIIQNQSLHATHYGFLNDSQEIRELLPNIIKMIRPHMERSLKRLGEGNPEARKLLEEKGLEHSALRESESIARALYKATYGDGERGGFMSRSSRHFAVMRAITSGSMVS